MQVECKSDLLLIYSIANKAFFQQIMLPAEMHSYMIHFCIIQHLSFNWIKSLINIASRSKQFFCSNKTKDVKKLNYLLIRLHTVLTTRATIAHDHAKLEDEARKFRSSENLGHYLIATFPSLPFLPRSLSVSPNAVLPLLSDSSSEKKFMAVWHSDDTALW